MLSGGYSCFGLVGAAQLFGIGVGLAMERNAGWLELKQASPMPPMAYLFAKCVTAVAFGLIIVGILIAMGMTMGGVTLPAGEMIRMLGMTVVGSICFASMGLAAVAGGAGQCRIGHHQPYLFAYVVHERTVDANRVSAALVAEDCAGASYVSPVAADA